MLHGGVVGRSVIAIAGLTLVFAAVAPAGVAYAAFAEQVARLHATDGVTGDEFGWGVDIDGDTAVVGVPGDDTDRGAVYVYVRTATGWVFQQKLTASVRAAGDRFGQSVAVSGDHIAVGAPGRTVTAHPEAGSIYTFGRVGGIWQPPALRDNPAPQDGEHYGWSVDMDGDTLVVGEPLSSGSVYGPEHGFARVYVWNGSSWAFLCGLEDTEVDATGMRLGWDVAVSGQTIVTGSPFEDSRAGTVSVWGFDGTVYVRRQKILVSGRAADDGIGASVDVSGNTLIIGAPGRDLASGMDAGAAYVYVNPGDAWEWQASLISPDPGEYEYFGMGTGLDGDTLVIGEMQGSSGAGAAYFFRRNGSLWPRVQDLEMSAASPEVSGFGCSTAVSNGTAVIGSFGASSATVSEPGGAFIYSHLEPVYRFYNARAGTHFYTPSAAERDHVIATWPAIFSYEGVAYKVNPENNPQALYRFYNMVSGSHFYTASTSEANHVMATWPHIYDYEGLTYRVSPAYSAAKQPVYRFYNLTNGSHFYTASLVERNHVMATWPHIYQYEGAAFWLGQ